jgi:hypothetical protein
LREVPSSSGSSRTSQRDVATNPLPWERAGRGAVHQHGYPSFFCEKQCGPELVSGPHFCCAIALLLRDLSPTSFPRWLHVRHRTVNERAWRRRREIPACKQQGRLCAPQRASQLRQYSWEIRERDQHLRNRSSTKVAS